MQVVTLVNQKGGVGKTTVALGLAATAWARRLDCLVIDIDPQGNATTGLGVWNPPFSVDHALAEERPGSIASLRATSGWPAENGRPPSVVPATPALAAREPQLMTDPIGANNRLSVALQGVDHDLVIIDCPPSLGLLTVNGLFAADQALIVTEPGAWASDGVDQILRTVKRVSSRRSEPLTLAGARGGGPPRAPASRSLWRAWSSTAWVAPGTPAIGTNNSEATTAPWCCRRCGSAPRSPKRLPTPCLSTPSGLGPVPPKPPPSSIPSSISSSTESTKSAKRWLMA
ncbi:MAG: AAA family ATPase [Acidimicrobiia bacterium]|nr:AAA family ATPase [Acidimicrobiia bacterium]